MVNAQKIAANTSFFMLALILQKLLSFIYFTVLARNLGVEAIGHYFFAISFATMFMVIMDLGMASVLIREVAKDQTIGQRWFNQIFSLKLLLTIVVAIVVLGLDLILFASDAVKPLIYVTLLITILDSFTLLFYAYIRGQQSLHFESWGTIIFQILILIFGFSALFLTKDVIIFLGVLLLASLFNFLFSLVILKNKFKIWPQIIWDRGFISQIILVTWPFALAAIFAKIYAYLDTFFLKIFIGSSAVGIYSIAYKITFALQFIPLAFVAAIYPALAHYFKNDKNNLVPTLSRAINYLAMIALPISAGIIFLGDQLVRQVYTSSFNSSVLPLQILCASLPFLFVNFALSSFLNATSQQKINTRNLGIVMLFNALLNLILIRFWQVSGASLASSLSTLLLFLLNLKAVLSTVPTHNFVLRPLYKALGATILMVLLVLVLRSIWAWYLVVLLAALAYVIFLFASRALTKTEIKLWLSSLARSK